MSPRFDGRVAIVTGATKGIGRAAAITLARAGARVVVTGRDAPGGAETVAEIAAFGGEAVFAPHDVRLEDDWARVVAVAEDRFGGLDILVNNAGIFLVKPLEETSEADFLQMFSVNVEGMFLGMRHAFEVFARRKVAGAIVNVSSLMGLVGYPGAIAYCASKGAVTAMTKVAAVEGAAMSPKVRVNSLHPGVIWTPMITSTFGDDKALADAFAADTPLRMVGRPEHMADAIAFLVSDDAAYITGAELTADGGRGAD